MPPKQNEKWLSRPFELLDALMTSKTKCCAIRRQLRHGFTVSFVVEDEEDVSLPQDIFAINNQGRMSIARRSGQRNEPSYRSTYATVAWLLDTTKPY